MTSEGINKFDLIWDVGSLCLVDIPQRDAYGVIIRSLLKPKGSILIATYNYDQALWNKPPFAIPPEEIQRMFGKEFDIVTAQSDGVEKLKKNYTVEEIFDAAKLPYFEWNFQLLNAKS